MSFVRDKNHFVQRNKKGSIAKALGYSQRHSYEVYLVLFLIAQNWKHIKKVLIYSILLFAFITTITIFLF